MDHYKGFHNKWPIFKTFSNPHTKHHFKQLKMQGKWIERATRREWVNMDVKGANTNNFKTHSTNTNLKNNFQNIETSFRKDKYTFVYIQTWIITKVATTMASFQNIFQNTHKVPFQTIENTISNN